MSHKLAAPGPEQIKEMEPDKLLQCFKRLIMMITNRYAVIASNYGWIDADDLEQIASIALLKAQKAFDPEGEFTFMSIAIKAMKWDIFRALKFRWTQDGSFKAEPITVSLNEPPYEDCDEDRIEQISSQDPPIEELIEVKDVCSRVREAVGALPEYESEIIKRIYLADPRESRKDIAAKKGTTQQNIINGERRGIRRLRIKLRDLADFQPHHIGVNKFNSTWTSEPEIYVLIREKEIEQLKHRFREFYQDTTGRNIEREDRHEETFEQGKETQGQGAGPRKGSGDYEHRI